MVRFGAMFGAWLRAAICTLLLVTLAAPAVWAHAKLDRAEPAPNAVVGSAPSTVKLWFTQELQTQGSTVEVVDAQGQRVDLGDAKVDLFDPDRKLMVVSLRPSLPHGAYTVHWTAVSAEDGHTERGEYVFYVGERPSAPPPATAPAPPAPKLHIESPKDGITVSADAVEIVAHLEGGKLADLGHLHVYIDGKYVMQADTERFVVRGLSDGEHVIKLELAGRDHHAWQPPVEAAVRVWVVGGVPGASRAAQPGYAADSHTHTSTPVVSSQLPRTGGAPLGAALPVGLALAAAGVVLRRLGR